jgi:hypothetical protein
MSELIKAHDAAAASWFIYSTCCRQKIARTIHNSQNPKGE